MKTKREIFLSSFIESKDKIRWETRLNSLSISLKSRERDGWNREVDILRAF